MLQDVCEGMYVLSAYVAGCLGSMRERVWSNKISVQQGGGSWDWQRAMAGFYRHSVIMACFGQGIADSRTRQRG